MEYTSLSQLMSELRRRVRDFADGVWSREDKVAALRSAARQVQGKFAIEAVHTSVSFAAGVYGYALPQYIRDITRVERRAQPVQDQGSSLQTLAWQDLTWWELKPTPSTNFLQIDASEQAQDVRIWYLDDVPPLPPAQMTLAAAITPTQTTIPVGVGVNTLNVGDYPERGWLTLQQNTLWEVLAYEGKTNTSFIRAQRGLYGVASSFPSGVQADPTVLMDRGGVGYEFIINQARAELYDIRMNDEAVGSRDERNFLLRWASQRAEMLRKLGQDRRPAASIRIGKRGRF